MRVTKVDGNHSWRRSEMTQFQHCRALEFSRPPSSRDWDLIGYTRTSPLPYPCDPLTGPYIILEVGNKSHDGFVEHRHHQAQINLFKVVLKSLNTLCSSTVALNYVLHCAAHISNFSTLL
eukprot:sb/3476165/